MRSLFVLALVLPLAAGCTPYIPMKADFGTSSAVPKGYIPPEYAQFNAYNPSVGPVLATQICATPFVPNTVTATDASPGELVSGTGICASHEPILGNGR